MTYSDIFELRRLVQSEEFDYGLLTSALAPYAAIRQKINQLLRQGVVERVKKGLYVFGANYRQAPVCKETLANLIYGPSYISLEYALAFYGLIPERVEVLTSVTSKRDKEFSTPLGQFTYRHLALQKYAFGIEQVWIDARHPVLMASPEKALCDLVVLNKIPVFNSSSAVRDFLYSDLRIDPEKLKKIRPEIFFKLNRIYKNKTLDQILEIL